MKSNYYLLFFILINCFIFSCEGDEGKLPLIAFKTGGSYILKDTVLPSNSAILIGITAAKAENKDVLKKFDISKSINGATALSIFNKDLTGAEGDTYNYDFRDTLTSTIGQLNKYTFTVTNRDGLVNQVFVTVGVK